jgi:hypothetical protein
MVMTGLAGGVQVTVKFVTLVPVLPFTVTEIAAAPSGVVAGIVVMILVDVLAVTLAATPLKATAFEAGKALNFLPVRVMGVPTGPDVGENSRISGDRSLSETTKGSETDAHPPTVTLTV